MNVSSDSLAPILPLDDPLPADLVSGLSWGPFRYPRFPVFSLSWFAHRFFLFLICILLYSGLTILGQLVAGKSWHLAFEAGGLFAAGALLMVSVGPALATWVRYLYWPRRREAMGVVIAIVLGLLSSIMADAWASARIQNVLDEVRVPPLERKVSQTDEALLMLTRIVGSGVYFVCGGGLAAMAYFSERRRILARHMHMTRLESDMRLAILQAQIEPHFLFNTLASIRPLIRQDAVRAEAALDALADHLRATIPQMRGMTGDALSTLGEQVNLCTSYLGLMQMRMGSRLSYEVDLPEALRLHVFPPLMLLSLVENAIKHGVEPKLGPGKIIISAQVVGTDLQVSVMDNGSGVKDGLTSGLGLSNIRGQLAVRFSGNARLEIATRPEGGTVASLIIPKS